MPTKQRIFIIPFDDKAVYLFKKEAELSRLIGEVSERDPSILFSIARIIVEESFQLFPRCDPEDLHDRKVHGMALFYYNPLILEILEQLLTEPDHYTFYPVKDEACGIPQSAMEEELLPIKVAYKIKNPEKLDIGTLNKEYFTKLGN